MAHYLVRLRKCYVFNDLDAAFLRAHAKAGQVAETTIKALQEQPMSNTELAANENPERVSHFSVPEMEAREQCTMRIGNFAELHIAPAAGVKEVSGYINGKNNVVYLGSGAWVSRLYLAIDGDDNVIFIGRGVKIDGIVITISGDASYGNFRGNSNELRIGLDSIVADSCIECKGSFNRLEIGAGVYAGQRSEFFLNGFGCSIRIGNRTSMTNAFIHAEEIDASILIGRDNMIAAYVAMSTSDKHPIFSSENFRRLNTSRDIQTGKHVWMASGVQLMKGAQIGDYCIIGKHTTVAAPMKDELSDGLAHHAVIHGTPAIVQRRNVSWLREMFFDLTGELNVKYPDAAAQTNFHRGHLFVRQGNECFVENQSETARKFYEMGRDAYDQALDCKKDYVYAYSARGIVYIHLAELALELPDINVAFECLSTARGAFMSALALDHKHVDSSFYFNQTSRILKDLDEVCKEGLQRLGRLIGLAAVHLQLATIECELYEAELAVRQYNKALMYIDQASAIGEIPVRILGYRDEVLGRCRELMS